MKITVREKQEKTIPYDEIKPGQVYEIENGTKLLKLKEQNAIVLSYSDGRDWLGIARGLKIFPAVKILGTIKEIIVE